MVVSMIGKKVIDENEVDGVIVRLGYSGKEDKGNWRITLRS